MTMAIMRCRFDPGGSIYVLTGCIIKLQNAVYYRLHHHKGCTYLHIDRSVVLKLVCNLTQHNNIPSVSIIRRAMLETEKKTFTSSWDMKRSIVSLIRRGHKATGCLDGARAIAMLLVFAFHSLIYCAWRSIDVISPAIFSGAPLHNGELAPPKNVAIISEWLTSWATQPFQVWIRPLLDHDMCIMYEYRTIYGRR